MNNRQNRAAAFGEIRAESEVVAASLRVLFAHLPAGEITDDEPLLFGLDERDTELVVVNAAGDQYTLGPSYARRSRAGHTTYFRDGVPHDLPPMDS